MSQYESYSSNFVSCQHKLPQHPSLLLSPDGGECCGRTNCNVIASGMSSCLQKLRDSVAEYQEKRGIPMHEQFGFFQLVATLLQSGVCAIATIFLMFYHLLPLLEIVLFLMRFILDKTIEITESESAIEVIFKTVLFSLELVFISMMIMCICIFILFPVFYLLSNIFGQIGTFIVGEDEKDLVPQA